MTAEFQAPRYVFDGMDVYIPWDRSLGSVLRCKVLVAAGDMARVFNEENKLDKWVRVDDLLVPTEEVARRIMET